MRVKCHIAPQKNTIRSLPISCRTLVRNFFENLFMLSIKDVILFGQNEGESFVSSSWDFLRILRMRWWMVCEWVDSNQEIKSIFPILKYLCLFCDYRYIRFKYPSPSSKIWLLSRGGTLVDIFIIFWFFLS